MEKQASRVESYRAVEKWPFRLRMKYAEGFIQVSFIGDMVEITINMNFCITFMQFRSLTKVAGQTCRKTMACCTERYKMLLPSSTWVTNLH